MPEKDIPVFTLDHFNLEKSDLTRSDLEVIMNVKGYIQDWEIFLKPKIKQPLSYKKLHPREGLITTEKALPKAPKVVVFQDSFYLRLIPYLSPCFKQSILISDKKVDFSIIRQEKPDLVLIEFVERHSGYCLFQGIQDALMGKK